VSSSFSISETLEESCVGVLERRYQQRSIQIAIAPLARGLGDETARMASSPVQRAILLRIVF
jgi:hypothetical protein